MKTDLLACPQTHQPLDVAPQHVVDALNADIARLSVRDLNGTLVREPLDSGLLRADGQVVYAVRRGVAVLFAGAGLCVNPPAVPAARQ